MTDNENRAAEETIAEAIDGAEEIRDPLEDLVEKTKLDPGAPFTPEVLERLAALKQDNRAAFEKLRAELKAVCRVTALDETLAEASGETGGGRGPPQAEILINIAEAAELFHTPDRVGFADLNIDGHRETWPIRSKGFKHWLAYLYFEQTGGAPIPRRCNRHLASSRRGHVSMRPSVLSMSVLGGWTAKSTSTSATRTGGRWR